MKADKVSDCSYKVANTNMQHNKRRRGRAGLPVLCVGLPRLATSGATWRLRSQAACTE